ncbi:hypothetical protein E0H80_10105 [Acinetobacter sp. ANC 4779]|nr:hypothetical protein E0H80_10105 [Acinetobacter sp. ANC 4779]
MKLFSIELEQAVRGIYWLRMPEYASSKVLNYAAALPQFYWTGRTTMTCMAECFRNTFEHAYTPLAGAKKRNAAEMRFDIILKDAKVNPNSAYHKVTLLEAFVLPRTIGPNHIR